MAKVLIVDDDRHVVQLTSEVLRLGGCEVAARTDPREGIVAFESFQPEVCVLDFSMPGMTGGDVCRRMKELDPTVEVVFLTGEADTGLAVEMMKLGALDYLLKPVNIPQLMTAVSRAAEHRRLVLENIAYRERLETLVVERTRALNETLDQLGVVHAATLHTLGLALDFRDQSTGGHSARVARLTKGIAEEIGVSGHALLQIEQGALLHDIGKLKIPDRILLKPGALTTDEWATIKCHPEYGREFLERIDFLGGAAELVYMHHEKFDGNGYPQGLRGDAIPIGARCFAIVDSVDALIYERPYHRAIPFDQAAAEIRRCAGSHFDPDLIDVALNHIESRLEKRAMSA
ncbi:MAG TPA: HD domain-containing phosphohydrolase [Terriglobia bacterium]|jgi:putative nucleotidyltransferase with HDIG domain